MKIYRSNKVFFVALFLLCPFLLFGERKAELPSYILEVTKKSPLFEKPSGKSILIAEAEEGTLLLLVEKSTKGLWLKVKDVEGVEAWIPKDRTDYALVDGARSEMFAIEQEEARLAFRKNSKKSRESEMSRVENMNPEQIAKTQEKEFRVAPLMRVLNRKNPASPRWGLRADLIASRVPVRGKMAETLLGVSLSLPADSKRRGDYSGDLHYGWKLPVWGAFFYGPEIGYSFDKIRGTQVRHHFSTSLLGGIALGPFDLTLKAGYDFFSVSQAHMEAQVGCSF